MRPASGDTAAVSPSPLRMEGAYWCIADATAQLSVACGDSRAVVGSGLMSTTLTPPWRGALEIVGYVRAVGTDSGAELALKGCPAWAWPFISFDFDPERRRHARRLAGSSNRGSNWSRSGCGGTPAKDLKRN